MKATIDSINKTIKLEEFPASLGEIIEFYNTYKLDINEYKIVGINYYSQPFIPGSVYYNTDTTNPYTADYHTFTRTLFNR